uniref:C2H2-type domain-containing protein n=1 Tax=Eptatretus burgeri TaxID=7764 RepID=A0A8C4PYI5_EPTBU
MKMDIVRVSPEIWDRTHVMTIVNHEPEELEFQEVREQRLIKQTLKEDFVFGDGHEWRKRSDEEILPKLGAEMKEQMKLRKCVVLLEKFTQMDKHTQKYPYHLHTKKGSYKCNECGKYFGLRSNLNRHYGIHVLEIPYKSWKYLTRVTNVGRSSEGRKDSIYI